jgi:hypothetical protein
MSENGAQLTFGELLARHGRIEVPLIQRDYAQGRVDQQEVRDEFLAALHQALCLPPDAQTLPLNLDFIYGSVEGQAASSFQPLDGQQRLTTLFLLHWYLAWRDGRSADLEALCADNAASRFTYHVRPSSSEFFDALVAFCPPVLPEAVPAVSTLIADQPWYFRNWRLDPTIQSGLVMLDAIHERFHQSQGLYARLVDTVQPAITFQLLDLKHFGLSDDLYIKMNARGKPLTPFETFKARYEQTLEDLFWDEQWMLDGQPVSVAEFFSRRMDTRWADFFWPYRDLDSHVFDGAVMNVFRAVILITRSPRADGFVEDITLLRNRFRTNTYAFFHQRDWLDRAFSETLMVLLDAWSAADIGLARQLPDTHYFDENIVFRKLLSDPTALGYEEIAQLAAYAQFLNAHGHEFDPSEFQEWMRVVFNLSVNTEYNRPADLQRSFAALAGLAPHMKSILNYLARAESEIAGFNQQQVAEEKLKAQLLLADDSWRPLVEQAERHGYFRGQIGFLLSFSGVSGHPAVRGEQAWDEQTHRGLRAAFSDVLRKAAAMFDGNGLKSLPDYRWERALLALGDYMVAARRNHSFLINAQAEQTSWKRLLRGAAVGLQQAEVLCALWARLSGTANLEGQLDAVIADASGFEDWRKAFLTTPAAIGYCGQRMIRRASDGAIYLLRKSQMNGTHAELFTYCLYKQVLQLARSEGRIQALVPSYYETITAEEEPAVLLEHYRDGPRLQFSVEFLEGGYEVTMLAPQPEHVPDSLSALLRDLGFASTSYVQLTKRCTKDDIESTIFELDRRLAVTSEGA